MNPVDLYPDTPLDAQYRPFSETLSVWRVVLTEFFAGTLKEPKP